MRLPQDIINKIIDLIAEDWPMQESPLLRQQVLKDLFSCSLTSRLFHASSKQHIFSHLYIKPRSRNRPWSDDFQFLLRHPDILPLIKSVVFHHDPLRFEAQDGSSCLAFYCALSDLYLPLIFQLLSGAPRLEDFEIDLRQLDSENPVHWTRFGEIARASIERLLIGESQHPPAIPASRSSVKNLRLRHILAFPSIIVARLPTLNRLFLDQATLTDFNDYPSIQSSAPRPSLLTLVVLDSPAAARMIYERAITDLSQAQELRMTIKDEQELQLAVSILTSMAACAKHITLSFRYFRAWNPLLSPRFPQMPQLPLLRSLLIEFKSTRISQDAYTVLCSLQRCNALEELRLVAYGSQFPDIQHKPRSAAASEPPWNVFDNLLRNPALFPSMRTITLELAVSDGEIRRMSAVTDAMSNVRHKLAEERKIHLDFRAYSYS